MSQREKSPVPSEEGVEVPYGRIDPQILRNMIEEFVSRDGAEWADRGCSLEDR